MKIYLVTNMKRVCSLLLCFFLSGCQYIPYLSNSEAQSTKAAYSQALQEAQSIATQLGVLDDLSQLKDRNVKGMFFDGESLTTDQAVLLRDDDIASLVGVFYVTDLEAAKTSIQNYVDNLKTMTNVYDATEIFKIDNAVLMDNGTDKIVLIIDKDVETSKKLAEKAVK